jgi:EAL domain-containing protein (putative c-di-GMP-specific phosphodiesterase class I)/CHASE2 domain-containing sensor protein
MFGLKTLRRFWQSRRRRIVIYAVLTGFTLGTTTLYLPAEDLLIGARSFVRQRPAPKDITVIAIDDRTLTEVGEDDVSRAMDAKLLDKLFEAGAKRVFFDRTFRFAKDPVGDEKFVQALKSHPGRIYLGAGPSDKDKYTDPLSNLPAEKFRDHARITGFPVLTHPFALMASFPYKTETTAGQVPSLSAALAGYNRGPREPEILDDFSALPEGFFRGDFSIDYRTIPTISYIDVIDGHFDRAAVAGHDVVIGATADIFKDENQMSFQGYAPGVYFHVIAAYTLKRGAPLQLGWLPAFVIVVLVVASGIGRGRSFDRYRISGLATVLVVGPLLLDRYGIEVEVIPAAVTAAVAIFRARALDRVEEATELNLVSGLPSLQSLRAITGEVSGSLIALKLRNYGAIVGSFEQPIEAQFAEEIVRRIRISEPGVLVYHEGDKFLWLSRIENPVDLFEHLEGMHRIVQNGLVLEGREIDVSFNCGVEMQPDRAVANRIASALQAAEQAVRDDELVCLFDPESNEVRWEISLLSSLDRAIDNGEVWVAYQPKFDLLANRVKGAEALARWTHPERGPISPEKFISIAEEYHRIERITQFVLNEAVRSTAALMELEPDFTVSVNISAQLLRNPNLPQMVSEVLAAHNLGPDRLILEITETDRLDRSSKTFDMMQRLVDSGLQLSIDDFGTGNATIDYLRYLPAKEVKIDKVFVSGMESSREDLLLVQSIVEMAHSLDRRVVAEGVENNVIMEMLRRMGCDQVQGYHVSRPVRIEELASMLDGIKVKKSG